MKISIGIERLLQWAFRDELPKRAIASIAALDVYLEIWRTAHADR